MTQLHTSDAKDLAGSVVEQAGDVVHDLAGRVRAVREVHVPQAEAGARAVRTRATRLLTGMFVAVLATGVAVLAVRRSHRSRHAVAQLGPDAGSSSDVPGPVFDPEDSPMTVEASVRG